MMTNNSTIAPAEIQTWLKECLAALFNIQPEQIDTDVPFDRYGLESSDAVGISADLEDWLGCDLGDPTLMYEYNTIESLAEFVAGVVNQKHLK